MRNWVLVWFGVCSLMAADMKINVALTLDEVSEDAEYFLQQPASFDTDSKGSFYVVDWVARVIFKWNSKGEFDKVIGAPGGGPGEFGFMGQGGPQGYLGIVEDVLYVYDGGRRAVQIFNTKGEFQKSEGLQVQLGRTNAFYIASAGKWIIDHSSFMRETPSLTVSLVDAQSQNETVVVERADTSFDRKSDGTRVTQVVIKGFSERLVTAYNQLNGQLIVGFNGEPSFSIYDLNGKLVKKVPVNRPRREVKEEDQKEFNEQGWIKNNTFFTTAFPERMPHYTGILPVGTDMFAVYEISPFNRNIDGILIDGEGTVKSKFRFSCGENGGLIGAKGKILRVRTDDEGYFNLEVLDFAS